MINTGLKFDADNNDVKTNKLGSKVTVAGDANITTKITQTGDDSTIVVTLNKDLNVKYRDSYQYCEKLALLLWATKCNR